MIKRVLFIAIIVSTIIFSESKYTESLSTEAPLNDKAEVESEPSFTLYKEDGETFEPIEGTKFVITDLDGNNVIGTDGKIVGNLENINGVDYYVLTTGENGFIKANLPQGLYKAIEVYVNDAYILAEDETDRTYYFEIGITSFNKPEWINGSRGYSWNYINSTIGNNNGGIMAVGSISEYSQEVSKEFYNGVDLNSDGMIDEVSVGKNDGIIISYDESGNYLWSETLGGNDDDGCNEIIQTRDGGYVVVGYLSSQIVYLNGKVITDLSQSNYDLTNKDGFLLKINQNGDYEWGIRIGGNLDDEITKVIETTDGNINIIGNFYSNTFNFYENNSNYNIVENLKNAGEVNSFIASYSIDGQYNWSQRIGGKDYIEICDITEVEESIAVAVNYKGTIEVDENNSISSYLPNYEDGLIINYSLNGHFQWDYTIYSAPTSLYSDNKYIRVTAITTTKENNLVVAIACSDVIKGKKYGDQDYTTIYTCQNNGITANLLVLSNKGDFIKNLYDLRATIVTASANNATMIFNDIVSTANNDILLGGYYYSSKNIDVDKDGSTSGEYDFKSSSEINSNGFLIKLDLNGNVKFSDCIYRNKRELYAPSNITSVDEINGEKVIAGGNFYWESTTTKNFYTKHSNEDSNQSYYLSRIGNVDGFIVVENSNGDTLEIVEPQNIIVDNFKKKYTITTEVKSHTEIDNNGNKKEVKGGKISGDYNQTIDGIHYIEDGLHYVETVKYGEASSKEIIITPEESYKVEKITINDEEYLNYTKDANGNVILPLFTNVTDNIYVTVTFSKKIVNFYDLPITGSYHIIILDLIGVVLICLGIIMISKKVNKN